MARHEAGLVYDGNTTTDTALSLRMSQLVAGRRDATRGHRVVRSQPRPSDGENVNIVILDELADHGRHANVPDMAFSWQKETGVVDFH